MSEPKLKPPAVGERATSSTVMCRVCRGLEFKILVDVRDLNAVVGTSIDNIPNAIDRIWCFECTKCGEQTIRGVKP